MKSRKCTDMLPIRMTNRGVWRVPTSWLQTLISQQRNSTIQNPFFEIKTGKIYFSKTSIPHLNHQLVSPSHDESHIQNTNNQHSCLKHCVEENWPTSQRAVQPAPRPPSWHVTYCHHDAREDEGRAGRLLRGQPATQRCRPPRVNKSERGNAKLATQLRFSAPRSQITAGPSPPAGRSLVSNESLIRAGMETRPRCPGPRATARESVIETPCDNTSSGWER